MTRRSMVGVRGTAKQNNGLGVLGDTNLISVMGKGARWQE